MYVRNKSKEERIALIELLESEGFKCVNYGIDVREDVINSYLPLSINIKEKNYISHGKCHLCCLCC